MSSNNRIKSNTPICTTILGCGEMGTALLKAWLSAPELSKLRYNACVSRTTSAHRLRAALNDHSSRVTVLVSGNLNAVRDADVVILAFLPSQVKSVLSQAQMLEALEGKVIISILASISRLQITDALGADGRDLTIVRVMPTLGTRAGDSCTLIAEDDPPTSADQMAFIETLFAPVGKTVRVLGDLFDSTMALTTVCHGMMSIAIDAVVDGSVASGIPRDIALKVAAQCFHGYSTLLRDGGNPAELKGTLMTPSGFTVNSMLRLERKGFRSAISDTVLETVASTKSSNKSG